MIKMTMDHQPNVEISTKCSEAEVTVPGLASGEAVIIVAAADLAKGAALEAVEAALAAAVEVLEAAEVALEATVEEGLVGAEVVSIVAAALEGVVVGEASGVDVDLEIEDMGGGAIRIMINVNCVFVTVL